MGNTNPPTKTPLHGLLYLFPKLLKLKIDVYNVMLYMHILGVKALVVPAIRQMEVRLRLIECYFMHKFGDEKGEDCDKGNWSFHEGKSRKTATNKHNFQHHKLALSGLHHELALTRSLV